MWRCLVCTGHQPTRYRRHSSLTSRNRKRSNPRSRGCSAALEITAHKPKHAIVCRIHHDIRVVFPAQARQLRRLALGEHRFVESKLTLRILRQTRREALASKVRIAAEGIAHTDIAFAVE